MSDEKLQKQKELLKLRNHQNNELEWKLCQIQNLSTALDMVCWEFVQEVIEDSHLKEIRSAICGIKDAIEARLAMETAPLEGPKVESAA